MELVEKGIGKQGIGKQRVWLGRWLAWGRRERENREVATCGWGSDAN